MADQELSKDEAERRAREVAQRMLTTPKPQMDEAVAQKKARRHKGKQSDEARSADS